MDTSTQGVTLYAGFLLDLLSCYEKSRDTFAKGLFDMAPTLDPANPTAPVPMAIYNDMCQWIEDEVGAASVSKAGQTIGDRVVDQMVSNGVIAAEASPLEILQALKQAADLMIQDPRGRGWEILESSEGRIVMRRTQTFNCILQEGLLKSLVARSGVEAPAVEHSSCTRDGAEFCEYTVTWWS